MRHMTWSPQISGKRTSINAGKHRVPKIVSKIFSKKVRAPVARLLPIFNAALLVLLGHRAASAEIIHDYSVIVDDALQQLRVEARFDRPITNVAARARDAGDWLVVIQDCDSGERLRVRNRRLSLPADGIRCMNYTVDLEQAAGAERRNLSLSDDNVLVSPSRWLWRPALSGDTKIRVRFELPDNVQVAVPWQPIGDAADEYLLGPSPESANAPVLFGTFTSNEIEVPGATLRVSVPQSEPSLDSSLIMDWLRAAATDVTLTYGRFPNPSPKIVVIPISGGRWSSRGAVPFGRVIRDGGEVIELFVNRDKPIEDFLGSWTATHEFSHLMLPYVDRRHKWISEGFAQYYQNVLMARSGAYDQARAWQKIHSGLARGNASRPELSPNQAAARGVRGARMKIYWTGAAIALMADIRLRERSGNRESLDDVLDRLQACCLPSERVWSGPELFSKLDTLIDEPVFMPLYRRHADATGFPDTSEVFERLGVEVGNDGVRFRQNAELAALRATITRVHPETAAWRRRLAGD